MGRSNMFYGGLETDKLQRRFRKHYSADGSMEITYDKTANKTTFVTYLMGDAYSSPVIWHSEQTSNTTANNFYYLHRDYLGSILAITDKEGVFKEKRHFDAWGNIVKITDGNNVALTKFAILDRGYTGHEHLLGVGLINMNARLYDPVLHRFLAPDNFVQDPFNTQNFNRYGYVLNNPLMYTDPSGKFIPFLVFAVGALIGAAVAGAAYAGTAIRTGDWNWGQFGLSMLGGAILGGFTAGQLPASMSVAYVTSTIGAGFATGLLPSANFQVGDWNFSVSPAIALGNSFSFGANFSVGYNDGNFGASAGYGISYTGKTLGTGWEKRKSWGANWDDGKNGFGVYSTSFSSGSTSQKVGGFSARSGDFGMRYENDFIEKPLVGIGKILGDGGDRFRTTALQLSYKNYSAGLKLFTGEPETSAAYPRDYDPGARHGVYSNPGANRYRLGAAFFGYKGYQGGYNSESIRGLIQNKLIHNHFTEDSGWFKQLNYAYPSTPYFQYQSPNPYTLW